MQTHRGLRAWIAWFGAQRWSKEAVLAVVLTLAAALFIAATVFGRDAAFEAQPLVRAPDRPLPQ
jgi:hypothetical protein